MRMKSVRAFVLFAAAAACLAVAERQGGIALSVAAAAQEGYPLAGTWYGDYGTGAQKRDLTVIMKWDGRTVTGIVNPGPNATPIKSAVMDITPGKPAPEGQNSTTGIPPKFNVRLEFDAPAAAGGTGPLVFEGTLQNPVAGNRRITGTWTRGAERGTFQLRRL
jgi:hypothetical protein